MLLRLGTGPAFCSFCTVSAPAFLLDCYHVTLPQSSWLTRTPQLVLLEPWREPWRSGVLNSSVSKAVCLRRLEGELCICFFWFLESSCIPWLMDLLSLESATAFSTLSPSSFLLFLSPYFHLPSHFHPQLFCCGSCLPLVRTLLITFGLNSDNPE